VEHERSADAKPDEPPVRRPDLAVVCVVPPLPKSLGGDSLDAPSILLVDMREQRVLEELGGVGENTLGLLTDVRESIRAQVVLGHDRVDRADELLETLVGRLDRQVPRSVRRRHLFTRWARYPKK